MVIEKS